MSIKTSTALSLSVFDELHLEIVKLWYSVSECEKRENKALQKIVRALEARLITLHFESERAKSFPERFN